MLGNREKVNQTLKKRCNGNLVPEITHFEKMSFLENVSDGIRKRRRNALPVSERWW